VGQSVSLFDEAAREAIEVFPPGSLREMIRLPATDNGPAVTLLL